MERSLGIETKVIKKRWRKGWEETCAAPPHTHTHTHMLPNMCTHTHTHTHIHAHTAQHMHTCV